MKRLTLYSCWFLQPNQPALRFSHRILLTTIVSRNEGHWWVRTFRLDPWRVADTSGLNISGKTRRISSGLPKCLHLSISSTWWRGSRATSIESLCFLAGLVGLASQYTPNEADLECQACPSQKLSRSWSVKFSSDSTEYMPTSTVITIR